MTPRTPEEREAVDLLARLATAAGDAKQVGDLVGAVLDDNAGERAHRIVTFALALTFAECVTVVEINGQQRRVKDEAAA